MKGQLTEYCNKKQPIFMKTGISEVNLTQKKLKSITSANLSTQSFSFLLSLRVLF